jgi:SAM-dependent methyltransferase
MGTIEQNERQWDSYQWRDQGDEWSKRWGGPDYQWSGTLYPRVREFLPAGTILEIAPGHGRWTHYLLSHCDRLIGVDLSAGCVAACTERFADRPQASFHKNDGRSLAAVPDGEVDFAFSFDSLVHAERDVLESYVHELARKLAPDGVAFIHHSNIAPYVDPKTGKLPFDNIGWRGATMSASLFEQFCREAGLCCIGQELVNWRTDEALNDCLSMLTRPGSRFARDNRVLENPGFMEEAGRIAGLAAFYGPAAFGG